MQERVRTSVKGKARVWGGDRVRVRITGRGHDKGKVKREGGALPLWVIVGVSISQGLTVGGGVCGGLANSAG